MRLNKRLFTIAFLSMLVTACSGGGSPSLPPSSSPQTSLAVTPTSNADSQTASVNQSGSIVWRAGDARHGRWIVANTNQCGSPVRNGSSFTFRLIKDGQRCGRNQLLPVDSGGQTELLQEGHSYTFTFHYIDGTPSGSGPGMGLDTGVADALIWQVHPWTCGSGTLGVRLNFIDNTDDIGLGNQHWGFYAPESLGSKLWWVGTYRAGEQDNFEIRLDPLSHGSSGVTKLYRNGVLQFSRSGPNYVDCDGHAPWWNFGPYKWRWEMPGGGGSHMSEVNATIENMTETSP